MKKRFYSAIVTIASILLIAGCSTISTRTALDQLYDTRRKQILNDLNSVDTIEAAKTNREKRNEILNDLIFLVDVNYNTRASRLYGEKTWTDFGGSIAVLGINAVGAATGAGELSRAMNAVSALIVGTKASVEKDLLQNQGIVAIIAKMNAGRAMALLSLQTGMKNPIDVYSLQAGLVDVGTYYYAGTVTTALASITASSGAQQAKADKASAKIKGVNLSGIPE